MEVKAIPGQLVESRSGRDGGRFYLVVEVIGDRYVLVADGSIRRLHNPKKKNIKHLIFHPQVANELMEKLNTGRRVTNAELCLAIGKLVRDSEG